MPGCCWIVLTVLDLHTQSTNLRQAVQGAVLPGSNLLNALANPAITNGLSNLAGGLLNI
jgi:hypothetical protein